MTEIEKVKIKEIKARVIRMLEERHAVTNQAPFSSPSQYWSDFCGFTSYMIDLSEEHFKYVRHHSLHLTGDNYLDYYSNYNSESFLQGSNYAAHVQDIPKEFQIQEPEGAAVGIGYRYPDGRFLSKDTFRYQRVVSTLYRHGIFSELNAKTASEGLQSRRFIFEIGGGYGGMAYHFPRLVKQSTYVILDLPEVLLFSATYLTQLYPDKKIYVYDKSDFETFICSPEARSYDFILVPNYKLSSLEHLKFDLVLNVASLQEMRTAQVETYLDFIRKTCVGTFYSWNKDIGPKNAENENLTLSLRQRFQLTEAPWLMTRKEAMVRKVKDQLRPIAVALKLKKPIDPHSTHIPAYREYLCKSLNA